MAQPATVVQEGVDQIRTAVRRADRELRKLQRRVTTRRRQLEKEVGARRKALEKRAERQLKQLQRQLQRQPLFQRAETLRADATALVQTGLASLVDALPVASKTEIERLDRKLAGLARKVRDLEKQQGAPSA